MADAYSIQWEISSNSEGSTSWIPTVPSPCDQVPSRATLQGSKQTTDDLLTIWSLSMCFHKKFCVSMLCNLDVDRRQVAVADGAEVGPSRHSFSPIRRPAHLQLQEGLHLRKPRCNEIARWRWRARIMWGKPCSYYILNIVPSLPWLDSALIQTHVSFVFDRSISTQWKEELFMRAMRAVWSTVWKVGPTMR